MAVKKVHKPNLLIADDERGSRETLFKFLRFEYDITLAEDGRIALNLLQRRSFDVVLTDINMPEVSGFDILKKTLEMPDPPPCILFTAYGTIDMAVEAMHQGAFDFVTKPVNMEQLSLRLKKALENRRIKQENKELHQQLRDIMKAPPILGESKAIRGILDTIKQVAPAKTPVLIEGESGTGKELVARALHEYSGRSGRFVAVHCAALPESLFESELFGHEAGAFTGAIEQKKGRFELADGGTLFLDEIGEIPLAVQVKLLRVLETKTFERVGSGETLSVDVRIVSATNRNLASMTAEGTFREDLFYRLNVVQISVPPLRERPSDIPILVNAFLAHFAEENGRKEMRITDEAMKELVSAYWHGNIRELKNCVENMVVLARSNVIDVDNLPASVKNGVPLIPVSKQAENTDVLHFDDEKTRIEKALASCHGNRTHAAEILGISRRTLHRKLNQYGIG